MNNNASKSPATGGAITLFFQGLIIVAGLIGLYYLYQYLFSSSGSQSNTLIASKIPANPPKPTVIDPTNLPPIYDSHLFGAIQADPACTSPHGRPVRPWWAAAA